MKKMIPVALLSILAIVVFLAILDSSVRTSTLVYRVPMVYLQTQPTPFMTKLFTDFEIDLDRPWPGTAGKDRMIFYWSGKAYPLPTLTSSTLTSLGFSLATPDSHLYSKTDGDHVLYFSFVGPDQPNALIGHCSSGTSHTCPFAISFNGGPKLAFPATNRDVERSLGPPDREISESTHPILLKIASLLSRLLP